ncbi:MAG: hypothetical protein K2J11_06320 [Oscillospiraceae bacterium]|nr:hypothetical protein [Oscillospiraceae bacterium]
MKTVHRTVFKDSFAAYRKKGERSCPLPLETALAVSHLLLRFERKGISRSAERDQRALPFGNSQP